jgi:hypothetical protein
MLILHGRRALAGTRARASLSRLAVLVGGPAAARERTRA